MKLADPLGQLYSLREEIASLCVVKCHMSHERVARMGESTLPVVRGYPDGTYQRIGLCSPELRAERLGCSHTSARIKLDDAINKLKKDFDDNDPLSLLDAELNWLNNQIHLLDHRKGDAEKAVARRLEEAHVAGDVQHSGKELLEATHEVHELERIHDEYVERIGRLRDRILIEIDVEIQRAFSMLDLGTRESVSCPEGLCLKRRFQ